MSTAIRTFQAGNAQVHVHPDADALGQAAATDAAAIIRDAIAQRGEARLVIGTGPSQDTVIAALTAMPDIDWSCIEVFHLDEYVGMGDDHPASFRRWLREHVVDTAHPKAAHYLPGDADDVDAACADYIAQLNRAPLDIAFLGFGENGHIAFNDPHVADFNDARPIKRVTMDERCRQQQVGEGHFATLDEVPREAVTLTCPTLMQPRHLICSVPDRRKAEAVRGALEGPISEQCPASAVRRHPAARVHLDTESASLLSAH